MTFKHLCFYSSLLISWPSLLWSVETDLSNDQYQQCPVTNNPLLKYSTPPTFSAENLDAINVSAEQVKNMGKTVTTFSGNVLIERHLLRLQADQVTHNKETQKLDLTGNIHADTENMALNSESGWLNIETNEAEFTNNTYFMPDTRLSGMVPLISMSKTKIGTLIDTQFSTCPPQRLDWHLNASELTLDRQSATGTAKHTVFWIKDIPIFYFPWIQFPLGDERRSGFLMPNIGSSSSSGFEMSTPWYWNIAPNHDAILTPRYMNKRGSMFSTDYRYLTKKSKGNLNFEYLAEDKEVQEERYLLHFDNRSQITDQLSMTLLANDASDNRYLNDLGSSISITNTTHLEKNARFNYKNGPWSAGIMAQAYQTVDLSITDTDKPYRRLPQVTLAATDDLLEFNNNYLTGSFTSEWVEFEHESTNKVQGSRFHINPRLSFPAKGNAWFVTPSAGFMHTQYDTTDTNGNKLKLDDRNMGTFSLDSGLFFEREYSDSSLIQTIEPRLFYLNIPHEEQSALPVFDTTEQDFSFASLFRETRFNGIDRIGDANQLTLALSSRMLDKDNGNELMSFSLGRILYFEDQLTSLDNTINSANSSDIIGEFTGTLKRWQTRATFQWNTQTEESDKRSVQFNYSASDKAVFNIGYRFHRDPVDELNNLEQTDISFAWPFATNYALLSRWNYSLTEKDDIEALVGIEYESCCWAVRLLSQRYLTNDTIEPYDTNIMLQLVLKGFGSITNKAATNTLKHAILGYQPDY